MMPVSAEIVAAVVIYGLIGASAAYFFALFGLYVQMTALAKYRPEIRWLGPDRNLATPRTFTYVLIWWAWTRAHRDIGDRAITRGVIVSRVLCVATVVGWVLLFASPRDFAERAEAWSKGKPYVQQTN